MSGLILISAGLTIRADCAGARGQVYAFKPLTTLLILALALRPTLSDCSFHRGLIVAGLVFSLAGDVALMLPSKGFVVGLASFLGAQLCYGTAFTLGMPWFPSLWPALVAAGAIALIFVFLSPYLGSMRWPVFVYLLAIVAMAWRAWVRWSITDETGALLAFGGAVSFVISDAILAANRFIKPIPRSPVFVLVPYFCAQWLIAMSIQV